MQWRVLIRKNKKLEEFRELSKDEQIAKANLELKKIEEPTFKKLGRKLGFSNTTEFFRNYKINVNQKTLEPKIIRKVTKINNLTREVTDITQEDIKTLKEMIVDYKRRKEVSNSDINDDEIIIRSIRVSKNIMKSFIDYCDYLGLKQTQAINRALKDFINK